MFQRLLGAALALVLALTPASAELATTAHHALLLDYDSGEVLWQKDGFTPMVPASMSKLMTIELLFQRLKDGRVKLADTFPISERAWKERSGSEMWVKVGDRISVDNLIHGILTVSANDGCIVVAEALGGTVEGFVKMMNQRAAQLGLKQSHFVNPDGLDQPPGQLMSAYDIARLSRWIIREYPRYYHYFSETSFSYSDIDQGNRNPLLGLVPGADGLKTGHLEASGYGLVGSAIRGGHRLILVVNGLGSKEARRDEGARLMEAGFREFRRYNLFKPGDKVADAAVFGGAQKTVPLTVKAPLAITLEVDSRPGMKVVVRYTGPLRAPVAQGAEVGTLVITAPGSPGLKVPLVAAQSVDGLGFFGRMILGIKALFGAA
jgi:D-alanyl-D-alanine carboxypeptidase (penicillin-binding protein 5/6)